MLVAGLRMVVPSLCGVAVPVSVSLLAPCTPVPVLASVALFLSFWSAWVTAESSAGLGVSLFVGSVSPCSLLSFFRPLAALPWNPRVPLGGDVLTCSTHRNASNEHDP